MSGLGTARRLGRALGFVVLAGVALLVAGATLVPGAFGSADVNENAGAHPPVQPRIHPLPLDGEAAGTASSVPVEAYARTSEGVALPNSAKTPGAVYPDVQTADICDCTLRARHPSAARQRGSGHVRELRALAERSQPVRSGPSDSGDAGRK